MAKTRKLLIIFRLTADVEDDETVFSRIKSFASVSVENFLNTAPVNPFTCVSHSALLHGNRHKNRQKKKQKSTQKNKNPHIKHKFSQSVDSIELQRLLFDILHVDLFDCHQR